MSDMKKLIGQLFVISFPGEVPSGQVLRFIADKKIGGVILFEANCRSHQQARENIERIRSVCSDFVPFVAIDQEGGRVSRLRKAPAEFRAAADFGDDGIEQFREEYSRSAVFMASIGINLNLAPVCDIFVNENNKCLAGRCFGTSAEVVSRYVTAAVRTAKSAGVLSCLKHFPGLGDCEIDPHLLTAEADYDRVVWGQRERLPFQAGVNAGAELIMTTHLRVPAFDETIATGSGEIISSILRENLMFDGPVITDDLTMKGADELGEMGPRTVAAFNAGHDLLLFGMDFDKTQEAYGYFCRAFERGDVAANRIQESLDRISGIKFKLDKAMPR